MQYPGASASVGALIHAREVVAVPQQGAPTHGNRMRLVSDASIRFFQPQPRCRRAPGLLSAGSVLIAAAGEVALERVANLGCRH